MKSPPFFKAAFYGLFVALVLFVYRQIQCPPDTSLFVKLAPVVTISLGCGALMYLGMRRDENRLDHDQPKKLNRTQIIIMLVTGFIFVVLAFPMGVRFAMDFGFLALLLEALFFKRKST